MRKVALFIGVILIFTISISCHAEAKDIMIGDIVVKGLTRTDQRLVLKHLPVRIGDKWSAETKELMEETLFATNIFDPFALQISTEKMTEDQVRVIIHLADPSYFMLHPLIYGVSIVNDLSFSQLNQRIINPWGNGVSFSVGVNWKSDDYKNDNPGPWKSFGLDFLGANGRSYTYEFRDFEEHKKFNQQRFDLTGYRHVFSMRRFISLNLVLQYFITYQNADYLRAGNLSEQEYVISTIKTELFKDLISIDLGHGFALGEDGVDYTYCSFDYAKVHEIGKEDGFVLSLKGGLATDNTPLCFQFLAGGYSDIPLRGHEFELAGNAYLVNNVEYHKQFPKKELLGIIFVDLGKVAGRGDDFSEADFMLDAGIGIGYNSPLGILRLDKGFNLLDGGDTWNFTMGHTF